MEPQDEFFLSEAEYIDALLSYSKSTDEWETEDWDRWGNKPLSGYGHLLNGTRRNFQAVFGRTIAISGVEVTLIHVEFTEAVSSYGYYDDAMFPQGWEGEGYIIFEVNGKFYRKNGYQNSYGDIRMQQEPPVPAKKTETTVNVWS